VIVLFLIVIVLGLGLAPGLFWLWFFYHRDKWEPEPKSAVIKTFFLGMAVVVPVLIVEIPLTIFKFNLAFAIVGLFCVGIIEEYAKYFVVRHGVYRREQFNEPMDGIVYAAASALGFASIENTLYFVSTVNRGVGLVVVVFLGRALLSTFGHALFSSLWGSALGKAKFDPARGRSLVIKGFFAAALTHGLFNSVLLLPYGIGLLVDGGLIIGLWFVVRRQIRIAEALSPFRVRAVKQ
jgi:RsiW-degrading membrane proteinase PrsW (M82 family)